MSYLRDLPINTLKIDGIFINDLVAPDCVQEESAEDHHLRDEGIVRTIITLGKSLGLSTVAECVEHDYQVQILKSMGCDVIQGYFYSRPLQVDALETYLGAHGRVSKES